MKSQKELPAVQLTHDLILWMIPKTQRFPRNYRFSLGNRLDERLYNILEKLIEAQWDRQNRKEHLFKANTDLNVTLHLGRLIHALKLVSFDQYNYFSERLVELGRQIGGWRGENEPGKKA